jgi:hypothetical protein
MPVAYTSHRAQALTLVPVFIWLAAPRGEAVIYLCVVVFWSYLTIAGNAPLVKAISVPFFQGQRPVHAGSEEAN